MKKVVGIRFKEAGKIYYFDPCNFSINKNDNVIVEIHFWYSIKL